MYSFFFLVIFATSAFAGPLSTWIAGGENALIQSYPYQVSLEYLGHHICGASIIQKNIVVTAAHCVNNSKPYDLQVRAGSSLAEQDGSMHQVQKFVVHEEFGISSDGKAYVNDIALLWLAEEIVFDDKRKEIRMFLTGQKPKTGDETKVTGWGKSIQGRLPQLQVVTVSIISPEVCNEVYKETYSAAKPDSQVCAGEYGKGSCWGDDGGPLTIQGKLAGIVSWGDACDKSSTPGVYTSVGFFRSWIDNAIYDFEPS